MKYKKPVARNLNDILIMGGVCNSGFSVGLSPGCVSGGGGGGEGGEGGGTSCVAPGASAPGNPDANCSPAGGATIGSCINGTKTP